MTDRRTVVLGRDVLELVTDILDALAAANEIEPKLFAFGNHLARVREGEHQHLELVNARLLTHDATELCRWVKVTRTGDTTPAAGVPREVKDAIQHIFAMPEWPFPRIDRVVQTPVFSAEGELIMKPGYHHSGIYYRPDPSLQALRIPRAATPDQAQVLARSILNEVFGDFPFQAASDRAHALAGLLLPFARDLIPGPTPIHLLLAPLMGTGKTLLAKAMAFPSSGDLPVTSQSDSEEEFRKRIVAQLGGAPMAVLLDNVKGKFSSAAFAAAITSTEFTDRRLNYNDQQLLLPNRALWLMTGNNLDLDAELMRRSIPIRINAEVEKPWERSGFRHPRLLKWMHESRQLLVWKACLIVQAWLDVGRPAGTATLGSFESYIEVIGGILDVAGVSGFMADRDDFDRTFDLESQGWTDLAERWWRLHKGGELKASDVLDIYDGLGEDFLHIGRRRDKAQAMGHELIGRRDAPVGRFFLRRTSNTIQNSYRYYLEQRT